MHFKANYKDGTSFDWDDRFKELNSVEAPYLHVDRDNIDSLEVIHEGKLIHKMYVADFQSFFIRRRVVRQMIGGEHEIYLVGLFDLDKSTKAITAIFDDGHTEFTSRWQDAPLDAIVPLDIETRVRWPIP